MLHLATVNVMFTAMYRVEASSSRVARVFEKLRILWSPLLAHFSSSAAAPHFASQIVHALVQRLADEGEDNADLSSAASHAARYQHAHTRQWRLTLLSSWLGQICSDYLPLTPNNGKSALKHTLSKRAVSASPLLAAALESTSTTAGAVTATDIASETERKTKVRATAVDSNAKNQ